MITADKIKLCIIHPNFKCGGSERFISIICNTINNDIFEVELYILDGSEQFYQITNPAIKAFPLNIKNVRRSLPAIIKIIKKSKPDIVFTASNHLNLFISIFKFLLPNKLKWVARESSIISLNSKRSKYGKTYDWLIKIFYRNIDRIICQSTFMQVDMIKNYKIKKENTVIIYNPVEEIKAAGSSYLPVPKSVYKFFTVGRLSPEKGIDRLLQALALCKMDYTFYIIGDGSEKMSLQQLATELNIHHKVFFEGQRSHPYNNMQEADLFLIGSHYEGFPNALLEAGILGIPVAGFDSPGGIAEIIDEHVNGFLADNNNIPALAEIIGKALNHPFDRQLIITRTRERFSATKITRQFEEYLLKTYQNNSDT